MFVLEKKRKILYNLLWSYFTNEIKELKSNRYIGPSFECYFLFVKASGCGAIASKFIIIYTYYYLNCYPKKNKWINDRDIYTMY